MSDVEHGAHVVALTQPGQTENLFLKRQESHYNLEITYYSNRALLKTGLAPTYAKLPPS
jgi:hypothetical protein